MRFARRYKWGKNTHTLKKAMSKLVLFCFKVVFMRTKVQISWDIIYFKKWLLQFA